MDSRREVGSGMTMENWVELAGTISAITAIAVQTIKIIWIDALMPDGIRRDTVIRVLNYVINFGLLMAVILFKGIFNPNDILFYMLLAGGQWVGSHVGQQTLSIASQPKEPSNVAK